MSLAAYIVKPAFLVVLFGTARFGAMALRKVIPPGKVRDFLFTETGPL